MDELQKEYTTLFNGITDTIYRLEHTITQLKHLQLRAEEAYLLGGGNGKAPPTGENLVLLEN